MKKRLCVMGNSLGVIIDKPILRVLGISTRSVLRVTTDGRRIVIEPTGDVLDPSELQSPRAALSREDEVAGAAVGDVNRYELQLDAHAVFLELVRRWGLDKVHLDALHHHPNPRIGAVGGWMEMPNSVMRATDDELGTVQRMRLCRDRLREGAGWTMALKEALQTFPKAAQSVTAA